MALEALKTQIQQEPVFRIVVLTAYNGYPDKWFRKEFLYTDETTYRSMFKRHVTTNSSHRSTCHIIGMQHTNDMWAILNEHTCAPTEL